MWGVVASGLGRGLAATLDQPPTLERHAPWLGVGWQEPSPQATPTLDRASTEENRDAWAGQPNVAYLPRSLAGLANRGGSGTHTPHPLGEIREYERVAVPRASAPST